MSRLMPQNRYRMVDLRTGKVVVVFQLRPGVRPLEGCREACCDLGIEVDVGSYRLDRLKQDPATRKFKWSRAYMFSLESE